MTCEICDTQTATMWVETPAWHWPEGAIPIRTKPILSCDDCGPQLGYKILAALEPVKT